MKVVVLASLILAAILLLGSAGPLAGQASAPSKPSPSDLSRAKSLGSPQAPITIEIFGDFQCPQCRLFYMAITQKVIANYVTPGKVYLVHRDFPLSMHSNARVAARWANAAALAGKFAEAEKVLYELQDAWAANGQIVPVLAGAFAPADMQKIRQFESVQSAQIDAAIRSDMDMGNARGVMGTPTVFVTHGGKTETLPQGGVSYDLLRQLLDYYLQHP